MAQLSSSFTTSLLLFHEQCRSNPAPTSHRFRTPSTHYTHSIMKDPNLAVPLDYTSNEFEEERNPFIDTGLTPLQAADALQNWWTVLNNRSKALWQ